MKTNFSLLFYLKKQKNYLNGNVPIDMRITVEGNRAEITTNRNYDPKRWNAKAGRAHWLKGRNQGVEHPS